MKNNSVTTWHKITVQALRAVDYDPILLDFYEKAILNYSTMEDALANYLAEKLSSEFFPLDDLNAIFLEAFKNSPEIRQDIEEDLIAIVDRDPAAGELITPFLNFKGYHALESYRVANWLWKQQRSDLALIFQSKISRIYGVDIHPAAKIGQRVLFDHATSIVIGATAVVGNDVSMLHEVTLGGTGNQQGDRHPKVQDGVLIGAGAKILGNIVIGEGAKIGAGSVVLHPVEPHTTVAGIPAKPVGCPKVDKPSLSMNQMID